MKYTTLGQTGIKVSKICLGTMNWGYQNTEKQAHRQMDIALERGINFFDTAELYPVMPQAHTQGDTERFIGSWLKKTGNRDKIVLASKVVGDNRGIFDWFRDGTPKANRKNIEQAIDGSLKRLQTDYLDVYYIHWPERNTNYFGKLGYTHHDMNDTFTPISETLKVMDDLVQAGKIKHVGISNETPWGMMDYLRAHGTLGLPRIQCIQNPYNFLDRTFEIGLAEMAIREEVGLNAYSPLGAGTLSGKYINGQLPKGSRLELFGDYYSRYSGDTTAIAIEKYVSLANDNGLSPVQMALSFVNTRDFLTSNIIGATSEEQLIENIESIDVELSDEMLIEIEKIHRQIPNPAP